MERWHKASWESGSWWHRGTWRNGGGSECSSDWQGHGDVGGDEFYQREWWNGQRREDVQVAADDRLDGAISLRLLELNGKETVICIWLSDTVVDVKIAIEGVRTVTRMGGGALWGAPNGSRTILITSHQHCHASIAILAQGLSSNRSRLTDSGLRYARGHED